MKLRTLALALPLTLAITGSVAFASTTATTATTTTTTAVTPATMLTIQQATDAVMKAGYTKVLSIKLHGDCYKVKALDAKGHKVKLHVNATTGVVTKKHWL